MYARAYLEGRLNEKQLDSFRQEVNPWVVFVSASMVDAKFLAISTVSCK